MGLPIAYVFKRHRTTDPRITINQITGASAVTTELEIQEVNISDSGSYYCKVEPRYLNHQPRKSVILRESTVSLKVMPYQLQNTAIPLTPHCLVLINSLFFSLVHL